METRSDIGNRGEDIAVRHLQSLGYEIRGRNVRVGRDEVDILARDPVDNVLVFAEVKTRSRPSGNFPPELNIHWWKKRRLMRSARIWVSNHDYDGGYRMDLVCVADGAVSDHFIELEWE